MGMNLNGTMQANNLYAQQKLAFSGNNAAIQQQSGTTNLLEGGQSDLELMTLSSRMQKQEENNNKTKIGIIGGIALAAGAVLMHSRGKNLNAENGVESGIFKNIATGVKTLFGKTKTEYKAKVATVAKKASKKNVGKASTGAQQGAKKISENLMDSAKENAVAAQKKIDSLQAKIGRLDQTTDAQKIKKLQKQVEQQKKQLSKLGNLTASEALSDDKAYQKLKDAKNAATEAYETALSKKNKITKQNTSLQNKIQALTAKQNQGTLDAGELEKLNRYQKQLAKNNTTLSNIQNGVVDAGGNYTTQPISGLLNAKTNAQKNAKTYKESVKALSEARVQSDIDSQLYKEIQEQLKDKTALSKGQNALLNTRKGNSEKSAENLKTLQTQWQGFLETVKV